MVWFDRLMAIRHTFRLNTDNKATVRKANR